MPEVPGSPDLRERDGVSWIEADLGSHRAVFTLRSRPGRDPEEPLLDLGRTVEAPSVDQMRARTALSRALELVPDRVRLVRQVHGDRLIEIDSVEPGETSGILDPDPPEKEADGMFISRGSSLVPAIVTADCMPVVVAGPAGAALLHLGWRGLATDLLERAVDRARGVIAVIGPTIGACCYEVGPEVFRELGLPTPASSARIDLASLARDRLARRGVTEIRTTGLCTHCEEELLFSHRRDADRAGRQLSLLLDIAGVGG